MKFDLFFSIEHIKPKMATTKSISPSNDITYDEILVTPSPLLTDESLRLNYDITTYLLFIFPLYICAISLNFLSIYSILITKIYRQYLSNVLLAVICIGSLINVHGQIFLILLRWTYNSPFNQLCSSSIYLRDSGSILIHTHILLLAFERILANLKKYSHNNIIQKAHFFLIIISLISIILSLTIPIYTLNHSSFSPFAGLCLPLNTISYKNYFHWIYYGFGHPFLWSACLIFSIFFLQKRTRIYSTLIPMNRMFFIISLFSCINLFLETLFHDIIGFGDDRPFNSIDLPSKTNFYLMNLRDLISMIHKIIIGLVFFLFRPEIRLWLYESMKRFQLNKKDVIIPQMLDIRNELDDNLNEIDDGNLQFRTDI